MGDRIMGTPEQSIPIVVRWPGARSDYIGLLKAENAALKTKLEQREATLEWMLRHGKTLLDEISDLRMQLSDEKARNV